MTRPMQVLLRVHYSRETDGRWIAEIPELPGAMVYGATLEQSTLRVQALALRVLASRLEHGEQVPVDAIVFSNEPG